MSLEEALQAPPPRGDAAPGCKIFIGALPHDMNSDELGEYFKTYGAVKDAVSMTQRGFGFVEFVEPESAQAALEAAPHVLHGREVAVKMAASRESMAQAKTTSDGHHAPVAANKLFVGGLPHHVETAQLADYFSSYGPLSDAVVMEKRGFGFVAFRDPGAAEAVMADSGSHTIDGQPITVKYADGMRPDRGPRPPLSSNGVVAFHSGGPMPMRPMPPMGALSGPPRAGPPAGFGGPTKIFVGGLPKDMPTEELHSYFSWYGRPVDCVVMAGRGFGFVEFEDPESARAAMVDEAKHVIRGMHVSVKFADGKGGGKGGGGGPPPGGCGGCGGFPPPRPALPPWHGPPAPGHAQVLEMPGPGGYGLAPPPPPTTSALAPPWAAPCGGAPPVGSRCPGSAAAPPGFKIFIRGIPDDASDEELKAYFGYYGPVLDSKAMTGRGFGFVTFGAREAADAALRDTGHQLRGLPLSLKPADGLKGAGAKGGCAPY